MQSDALETKITLFDTGQMYLVLNLQTYQSGYDKPRYQVMGGFYQDMYGLVFKLQDGNSYGY